VPASTVTTPKARGHRHRKHVKAVPTAAPRKGFPLWVTAGFTLAGVLILSGLGGFIFTRTRP